jgi:uncharacterized membrane protein
MLMANQTAPVQAAPVQKTTAPSITPRRLAIGLVCASLMMMAACSQSDGISSDPEPYDGIAPDETIMLSGTEPFWGIAIDNDVATYNTPENSDGTVFEVSRFSGNNGLGFSGKLDGAAVDITVTPGDCSDNMSDRTYPFTATVSLGGEVLRGCGYTDRQSFTGAEAP